METAMETAVETAFERKFHTDGFSGKTVVAGFSGGADSTALLYFLKTHVARLNCRVMAVHINHGLRGAPEIGRALRAGRALSRLF